METEQQTLSQKIEFDKPSGRRKVPVMRLFITSAIAIAVISLVSLVAPAAQNSGGLKLSDIQADKSTQIGKAIKQGRTWYIEMVLPPIE